MNPQDSPAATARRLIRSATTAALATAALATAKPGSGGWPYASLVQIATDDAGAPLLLISTLAEHTRNIGADARISLLIDGTAGLAEPLTGARVSLQGRIAVTTGTRERERYLARFPGAAAYAGFGDFQLYRVEPERAHLVAGFGRITWIEAADLVLPPDLAAAMAALEPGVLAHMNRDHTDAVGLFAEQLLGVPGDDATLVGFDAEGCDVLAAGRVRRVAFDLPVRDGATARSAFAALAEGARRRGGAA